MATRLQSVQGRGIKALLLQQRGPVQRGEIGQVNRLLGVQAPVQHAVERFGGEVDDECTARATAAHDQLSGSLIKDQRGGHAGARTFAGLHAVGNRQAVRPGGLKAEIGQLVVEQKTTCQTHTAVHHLTRTPSVFNGGGHGHGVAIGVHHRDVRGAVLRLLRHGSVGHRRGSRVAGWGGLHAAARGAGVDCGGPAGEVGRIQKALPVARRRLHKRRIGHKLRAVGKGQS